MGSLKLREPLISVILDFTRMIRSPLEDPNFDFYRIPLASSGYRGYGVGKPNDGSVEKDDFETSLRKNAPMFNLDNFIRGIKPESLVLSANHISFQCSDIYDWTLICGAYDNLDLRDLSFTDWHNC